MMLNYKQNVIKIDLNKSVQNWFYKIYIKKISIRHYEKIETL